mgnify:CR=1 FL=1
MNKLTICIESSFYDEPLIGIALVSAEDVINPDYTYMFYRAMGGTWCIVRTI